MKFLAIDLNYPAHYLNFGVLSVSVGNLIMISAVVALFALALALPFPGHNSSEPDISDQNKGRE